MLDFNAFELKDDRAIYLQIVDFVKRGIIAQQVKHGDDMPSRRVLSALLGVNPNTIQKSYKLLEEQGLLVSKAGAKSYISVDNNSVKTIKQEMIKENLRETIRELKQMGIAQAEAYQLFSAYWEDEDE